MQQTIDSVEIDEGPVIGEATYLSVHDVTFVHFGVTPLSDDALLVFGDCTTVDDNILFGNIELDDLAANFLLDQLLHLSCIANSAARSRHESAHSDIDAQTAFYETSNRSRNGGLLEEGLFE